MVMAMDIYWPWGSTQAQRTPQKAQGREKYVRENYRDARRDSNDNSHHNNQTRDDRREKNWVK